MQDLTHPVERQDANHHPGADSQFSAQEVCDHFNAFSKRAIGEIDSAAEPVDDSRSFIWGIVEIVLEEDLG